MNSIILLGCALIAYVVLVRHTRDLMAPSAVLCLLWFGSASLADIPFLKDSSIQHGWELETYAAVYFSGFSMFAFGFLQLRKRGNNLANCQSSAIFRAATTLLMILSVAAVAMRFYSSGFHIEQLILNFGGGDLKVEIPNGIPVFHYFEIMTPLLCLCAIFELKQSLKLSKLRRYGLISYVLYSMIIYSSILTLSRGTLLTIICGILYLYVRSGNLRFTSLVVIGIFVVAAMSGISFLRMSALNMSNSFLGDEPLMMLLSPIYTYVAFNFENFNNLVKAEISPTYVFYALKFLLWPFLKSDYESGVIRLVDFDTLFFNARTFLYPFYHDLGIVGCLLYPGLISFVLVKIHNLSIENPELVIILMGLQKAIFFTFFGNYFFGEAVILVPLLALGVLAVIYRQPRRRI